MILPVQWDKHRELLLGTSCLGGTILVILKTAYCFSPESTYGIAFPFFLFSVQNYSVSSFMISANKTNETEFSRSSLYYQSLLSKYPKKQLQSTWGAMAQQEDGWPPGLQLLNMRVGLVRNGDFSGSISFNTLITGSSSSSTDSSSDLDTESTGSFFHERSITLGSLIGVSSILELSGRTIRGRREEALRGKKSYRYKSWFFSLCSKVSTDAENTNNPPSLGHFLEVERRAANGYRSESESSRA